MSSLTAPTLVLDQLLRVGRGDVTFDAFVTACLDAREFLYCENDFLATSASSSSDASENMQDLRFPTHRVLLRMRPARAPKNSLNKQKNQSFWRFTEAVPESHAHPQRMVQFPVQVFFSESLFLVDLKFHYESGAAFWQRHRVPAHVSGAKRKTASATSEEPDFDVDTGSNVAGYAGDDHGLEEIDIVIYTDDDYDDETVASDRSKFMRFAQSNAQMSNIFSSRATLVAVSPNSTYFSMFCAPDVYLGADQRIRRCPGHAIFCGQFKGQSWCDCPHSNLRFCDINSEDSNKVEEMLQFSSKDGVFCIHQHHLSNNFLSIDLLDTTQTAKLEMPVKSFNVSFDSNLDETNEPMQATFSPSFLGGSAMIGCIDFSGFCRSCRKKSCQHSRSGAYAAAPSRNMIEHPSISEHVHDGGDGVWQFNRRNNVDTVAACDFKELSKITFPGCGTEIRIGCLDEYACPMPDCGKDLFPIPAPAESHAGPVYVLHDTVAYENVELCRLQCTGCEKIFDAPYEREGLWRINANTFVSLMLMYSIDSLRSKGHALPIAAYAESRAILYEESGCRGAAARIRQHRSLLHGSYLQFALMFHPQDLAEGIRCVCPDGVKRVGVDGVAYAPPPKQGSFSPLPRDPQRTFAPKDTLERFILNWRAGHSKVARELLTKYFCCRISSDELATLRASLSVAGADQKLQCWSFLVNAPCVMPGSETKPRKSVEYLISALLSPSPITTLIHSPAVQPIQEIIASQGVFLSSSANLKILSKHAPIFWGVLKEIESDNLVTEDFCTSFRTLLRVCLEVLGNWLPAEAPNYDANHQQQISNPIREFYQYGHYFPSHPIVRALGQYAADNAKRGEASLPPNSCVKEATPVTRTTRVLLPFICLDCEHCFGFSCIDAFESPRAVFDVLFMRFVQAPLCVFYDNACHLSLYCALREPWFFRDTDFTVDRFHAPNHKQDVCSTTHSAALQPQYNGYNSQLMEQLNSRFAELSVALRFCCPGSYLVTLVIAIFKDNRHRAANLKVCPQFRLRTSRAAHALAMESL